MAKLYGEILSSALMTFDKSFARANGQPLDSTEVYYSLAAAQEYAAGAGAYVGQKIVVVEDGVVTHYSIENEAGALKELGSKPVGDNNSIVVAEDGTVSLKGVGTLVFERDILDEEGQPTGEKEAIQYQPLMTSAGLIWVEPSKTTVEGLATLIEGLSARIKAIEDDYLKADDIADMATDAEVEAAIKVETDRAEAAEKALGERIDGVDGKFASYVTTESFGTFKTENTQAIADAKSGAETTAANALATARLEITSEIEDAVEVAQGRADDAYELAETKLDANEYQGDKVIADNDRKAIREMAEATKERVDTFLDTEGVAEVVDSLKDIKAELDKMADATEMVEALAAKADKTTVEGIDTRVKVIEDAPYVKKSELEAVDGKFASYTNTEALTELLAGKQDVIPAETYDAFGAAATAKSEAIEAAATAAAGLYATIETVNGVDERVAELEKIDHSLYALASDVQAHITEAGNTYATKAELTAHDEAAAATYATQEALKATDDKAVSNTNLITNLTGRLDGIVAQGGEPNAINTIKVNGVAQTIDSEKAVDITVPTKFTDLTDDSGFGNRLTVVEGAVVTAQSTADAAGTAAAQAQNEVDALEKEVGGIQTTVAGHTETLTGYGTRIGTLEQADITHATEYSELKGIVTGHTEAIAKKADSSTVESVAAKASANEEAIKTLNEVTIVNINNAISNKADATNVYTKEEINNITGGVAEGKTIVEMINEIVTENAYDDTAVKKLISDEVTRATEVETGLESRIATMEDFWKAADDNEVIDKLAEIVSYIENDKSGALDMAGDIQANADAIAAINNETTGILTVAKKYTDDQINALPAATAEALGLVKYDDSTIKMNESKQLYVAKVSTDILEQGKLELVLNGGSATV